MALIYATTVRLSTRPVTQGVRLVFTGLQGSQLKPTSLRLWLRDGATTPPSTRSEAPLVAEDRGLDI
jgi:hypothetical protein